MNRPEVSKLLAVIAQAFPSRFQIHERAALATEATWHSIIGDLPYELADRALRAHLSLSPHPPAPAEIRARALEIQRGNRKTGLEAWGGVVRAMKREGAHRTPGADFVFSDPITAKLVRDMGWQELCAAEDVAHTSDRARFIEAYDRLAADRQREAQSPTLAQAAAQRTGQVTTGGAVARVLELARGRDGDGA